MSFTCQISTKVCSACGETKPESEYYSKTSRHAARALAHDLHSEAKPTLPCMYEEQGGCCGICRLPFDMLCVDHCHETGRIRGLLCTTCNKSLGGFKDDKERLQRAIDWLLADH